MLYFGNGYGIRVISRHGSYTNENYPYEVAILKVTKIMKQVQELKGE